MALKQYLCYPITTTSHLESLPLVTNFGVELILPSIQHFIDEKMLDYITLSVIIPKNCPIICLPITNYSYSPTLSCAVVHQCLAHIGEDEFDTMCHQQSMIGLPKCPFQCEAYSCPICTSCKYAHPAKGHTIDTSNINNGELLHIDVSFWDVVSHQGFTSMLTIFDTHTSYGFFVLLPSTHLLIFFIISFP